MDWSELVSGPPLQWVQPSMWKMNYQLVRGNKVVTTMRFKTSFHSLATVENEDGCWTFDRIGFFQRRVSVRLCGSEAEIASFRTTDWKGGGTLELQNGRHILVTTNGWQTQLEFKEATGESLMRFNCDSVWYTAATVSITTQALSAPETSWIVAFGWYLMTMMHGRGLILPPVMVSGGPVALPSIYSRMTGTDFDSKALDDSTSSNPVRPRCPSRTHLKIWIL